ncbi:MAG: RNA-binding domain-containing protein [Thermoanaerobaculia bacterium]
MPLDPRAVFDSFATYLTHFLAADDADVEDQLFDRKEVPRLVNGAVTQSALREFREQIRETISAFANSNAEGGLLILGISKSGELRGVDHLTDAQRNSLTNTGQLLRNHTATVKLEDCADDTSALKRVILIHVTETRDAICESIESVPRAWRRAGAQNLHLAERDRDQLRRDKQITDSFERRIASRYDATEIDQALLQEIRDTWPELANVERTSEDLLHAVGALERRSDGYSFTNAGLLFFSANPQRVLPSAHIRILRYESASTDANPGDPSLDRTFTGSITHQLLHVRDFLRESGLIRVYHVRRPDGGFAEEPELPFTAVDEAIVNAVAHRDYALEWPIECIYYRDALVVKNPGRILQRSGAVPATFRLDERNLQSMPRNPMLMGWLKQSKDQKGQLFVRQLSEGTRAMLLAMTEAGLPPPEYSVTDAETTLTLRIDTSRHVRPVGRSSEFANVYPLEADGPLPEDWRLAVLGTLRDRLKAEGWFIDRFAHGRITAHSKGQDVDLPSAVRKVVRLFPAYHFALRHFHGRAYLVIDYGVEVKSVLTLADLQRRGRHVGGYVDRWAVARTRDGWEDVKVLRANEAGVEVIVRDHSRTERLHLDAVIPNIGLADIRLELDGITFDLSTEIKRRSLASIQGAARKRAELTQTTAEGIAEGIFPLRVGGVSLRLLPEAVRLDASSGLVARTLAEPLVEFGRQKETSNIRDGITEFGAYSHESNEIELVPVVAEPHRAAMHALIERLKSGKFRYKGAERTFGTRFTYNTIIGIQSNESIDATCARLLEEHPAWRGDPHFPRLFLVHTPEAGFSLDDEHAPYYTTKRTLLEAGVPCQMVDTPTLVNPDWKDLNLALNIAAKCGVVPWVLPEGIPDADFFVGLSYTQHRGRSDERLMGYANVFNRYGRWLFYSGNMQTFAYEERTTRLATLVEETLKRVDDLSQTPHVYFHYSARFSHDDRMALVKAARRVRPLGTYSFIWINSHHPVRLYDERPESDGSLARGTYVVTADNQLLLSTTGYNPYRKGLGTPLPLEINTWAYRAKGQAETPPDLHALARQILALTKLNWSSSDALTGEPITTKYAGDIAYLTAAFLRQKSTFTLHAALETTPWFL